MQHFNNKTTRVPKQRETLGSHDVPEHDLGCVWHPVVRYYGVWIGITYQGKDQLFTASVSHNGNEPMDEILADSIWNARIALDDLFERPSPSRAARLADAYRCIRASEPLSLEMRGGLQSRGPYRYGRRIKKMLTSDEQFGVWE